MHAVRGTIGFDPTPPSPEAKRESRDRHFAAIAREAEEQARRDRADEVVTANAAVIEEWAQGAKFLVTWKNTEGQPRRCGFVSGGLSAESVVRLLGVLTRNGITVVQVERID